jgi:Fe-S oxidoreductase
MTRVYDLCHGCRLCDNLCPAFPSLFDMIDANDGAVDELTAAEQVGFRSLDLLKLTGTKVTVIDKCSGIDGTWGYRAVHFDESVEVARPLVEAIKKADAKVVVGDCVHGR